MTYYVYLDDFLMPSILYRVSQNGKGQIWGKKWEDKDVADFGEVFEIEERAARKAFPSEAFLPE